MNNNGKVNRHDLLVNVVKEPRLIKSLELDDWDALIRQARRADMLARLRVILDEEKLLEQVPENVIGHLDSDHVLAEGHARAVRWEVNRIQHALLDTGVPVILLKGAAYVMAGLPVGQGRLFYDVDILVPKAQLESVERALLRNGWVSTHLDAYDQRYYRQWMHELPPLKHIQRQTVLDVHHAILPETANLNPDAGKLIDAAVCIPGNREIYTLAPEDMLLHSATHLFHEGEFEHGFRDLVDIDTLVCFFSEGDAFWKKLMDRAIEMDLSRPLYYALHYSNAILETPVPEKVLKRAEYGKPKGLVKFIMDALYIRALMPDHPDFERPGTTISRWLLYIRSHYIRMPLYLLIPHLLRKAFKPKK